MHRLAVRTDQLVGMASSMALSISYKADSAFCNLSVVMAIIESTQFPKSQDQHVYSNGYSFLSTHPSCIPDRITNDAQPVLASGCLSQAIRPMKES